MWKCNCVQYVLVDSALFCFFDGFSLCGVSTVEVVKVEISKEGLNGVGINDGRAREQEVGEGKCVIEGIGCVDIAIKVVWKGGLMWLVMTLVCI